MWINCNQKLRSRLGLSHLCFFLSFCCSKIQLPCVLLLIYVFWEILKNQSPLSPAEVLKIIRSFLEIKFVPFQLLNVLFSYLWISPSVYWQLLFRVRIIDLWLTPWNLALVPPLYWSCALEGHWWPHSSQL